MDLDFLSGLLLAIVVLATLAYVIKEMLADRGGDLKEAPRRLADTVARHVASDAKPVNAHLIGAIGTVTAHSDDSARPMKIRLGLELWPARLSSAPEESRLPVGTQVKVTAVNGPVAVVEPSLGGAGSADR